MRRLLAFAFALSGCSLVLDEPSPFVESRQDAAEVDRGPLLPDLAVEDVFVPRPDMARADMADAEPSDAGPPCPDGGCLDGVAM